MLHLINLKSFITFKVGSSLRRNAQKSTLFPLPTAKRPTSYVTCYLQQWGFLFIWQIVWKDLVLKHAVQLLQRQDKLCWTAWSDAKYLPFTLVTVPFAPNPVILLFSNEFEKMNSNDHKHPITLLIKFMRQTIAPVVVDADVFKFTFLTEQQIQRCRVYGVGGFTPSSTFSSFRYVVKSQCCGKIDCYRENWVLGCVAVYIVSFSV